MLILSGLNASYYVFKSEHYSFKNSRRLQVTIAGGRNQNSRHFVFNLSSQVTMINKSEENTPLAPIAAAINHSDENTNNSPISMEVEQKTESNLKTERLTSFDVLRGLCIMGMVIDHVRGFIFDDPNSTRIEERFNATPDYFYLYDQEKALTTYRWILRCLFPYAAPGISLQIPHCVIL